MDGRLTMYLIVDRFYGTQDCTLGRLLLWSKRPDNTGQETFLCFTLEDAWRATKVAGKTRIPAGTYEIKLRPEGGKYQKYVALYPWIKPGMLHITNVPGFEWILIHPGNTVEHTEGCLLVGYGSTIPTASISYSVDAFKDLYTKVVSAMTAGEAVFIEYQDNDK